MFRKSFFSSEVMSISVVEGSCTKMYHVKNKFGKVTRLKMSL